MEPIITNPGNNSTEERMNQSHPRQTIPMSNFFPPPQLKCKNA